MESQIEEEAKRYGNWGYIGVYRDNEQEVTLALLPGTLFAGLRLRVLGLRFRA